MNGFAAFGYFYCGKKLKMDGNDAQSPVNTNRNNYQETPKKLTGKITGAIAFVATCITAFVAMLSPEFMAVVNNVKQFFRQLIIK